MEKRTEELSEGLHTLGVDLPEAVLCRCLSFLDELAKWGAKINLTAITAPQDALEKHLIDSLALCGYLQKGRVLDVGSGAGLPAIPIAIAKPELQIYSVESVGKKVNFQKHVRRKLNLDNFTPLHARVEALSGMDPFRVVTARAFAPILKILQFVDPLVAQGGEVLLLRGSKDEMSSEESSQMISQVGYQLIASHHYELPYSLSKRHILKFVRL